MDRFLLGHLPDGDILRQLVNLALPAALLLHPLSVHHDGALADVGVLRPAVVLTQDAEVRAAARAVQVAALSAIHTAVDAGEVRLAALTVTGYAYSYTIQLSHTRS